MASSESVSMSDATQAATGLTYARARFYLGLVNVGFWVVVSAVGLLAGLPASLFPTVDTDPNETSTRLVLIIIGYLVISLPFDLIGGYVLPRRYRRSIQTVPHYLVQWLRAGLVQGVVMYLTGMLLVTAGKQSRSVFLVVVLVGIVMAVLLGAQNWIARLANGFRKLTVDLEPIGKLIQRWGLDLPEDIVVYNHTNAAFTGGLPGLTGMEKYVLPAKWFTALTPEQTAVALARRIGAVQRESRSRGVWVAALWNLVGFWLAASWAGGLEAISSARGLFETILFFNLWAFLGIPVLSWLSRPGVYEVDRFAHHQGVSDDLLTDTVDALSALQGEDAKHPRWIELLADPIPAANKRQRKFSRKNVSGVSFGAWGAAWLAPYLSWACLSFMPRAVPGLVGQTECWVLPPSD